MVTREEQRQAEMAQGQKVVQQNATRLRMDTLENQGLLKIEQGAIERRYLLRSTKNDPWVTIYVSRGAASGDAIKGAYPEGLTAALHMALQFSGIDKSAVVPEPTHTITAEQREYRRRMHEQNKLRWGE